MSSQEPGPAQTVREDNLNAPQRWTRATTLGLATISAIVILMYQSNPSWLDTAGGLRWTAKARPIPKKTLIQIAKKEKLKTPNKLAIEHNISTETVQVAVIKAMEHARTKLGAVSNINSINQRANQTPAARKGVISTIDRDYEFEEMFIDHPDLRHVDSKLKELTLQKRVKSIYVTHAIPALELASAPPVLLLHGAKFSSITWEKTKTVKTLVDSGLHVYSVDLPGYGRSQGTVDAAIRGDFLKGLIAKLELVRPFIVAPSMSGSFAIPYIQVHAKNISGLALIAPIGVQKVTLPAWHNIADNTPIMYVYGSLDGLIGIPGAKYLETVRAIQFFKVKDGTHPCYIDKPKQFNKKLRKFLLRKFDKGKKSKNANKKHGGSSSSERHKRN